MRNIEKTIVAALVAAEEIKDTTVEAPKTEIKRPRRRRLGRRFGAINYMSGSDSIRMPFTVRFPS